MLNLYTVHFLLLFTLSKKAIVTFPEAFEARKSLDMLRWR